MVPISAYEMSTHADFVACIALYVTPVAAHCDSTRTPRMANRPAASTRKPDRCSAVIAVADGHASDTRGPAHVATCADALHSGGVPLLGVLATASNVTEQRGGTVKCVVGYLARNTARHTPC